ncbi:hypothetical protein [Psychroserpens sp. MEBiC05023]
MKKTIIKIMACFLIVTGCSDDNNLLEDIAVRGGFVQFKEAPTTLNLNILELDTAMVSEELVDPNNNIISYSLNLFYEDIVVTDFLILNNFPTNLNISVNDITSALGISNDDVSLDTEFTFVALITTPTGTFSGETPDLDENNVNLGGDSTVRLKATGLRDAIEFNVTFFQPPAKTVRMTSFEEVTIGPNDEPYVRNGGADETGDLVNGANPPFVDFTATGTSPEDEIGFNTEYIAVPGISSSGLGFTAERIGVYSLLEDYEAYPDGTQGFHMEDIDGMIRITFDVVDVPDGQENSGISFQAFFNDTSWEALDGFHAYVNITTDSGSDVIEMVNIFDDEVEAVAGVWNTYNTGFLTGVRSYQLVLEGSGGATPESIDIDNVIVYETED